MESVPLSVGYVLSRVCCFHCSSFPYIFAAAVTSMYAVQSFQLQKIDTVKWEKEKSIFQVECTPWFRKFAFQN